MKGTIVSRILGTILGAAVLVVGLAAAGVGMMDNTHPTVKYAVSFRLMSHAATAGAAVDRSNTD